MNVIKIQFIVQLPIVFKNHFYQIPRWKMFHTSIVSKYLINYLYGLIVMLKSKIVKQNKLKKL